MVAVELEYVEPHPVVYVVFAGLDDVCFGVFTTLAAAMEMCRDTANDQTQKPGGYPESNWNLKGDPTNGWNYAVDEAAEWRNDGEHIDLSYYITQEALRDVTLPIKALPTVKIENPS